MNLPSAKDTNPSTRSSPCVSISRWDSSPPLGRYVRSSSRRTSPCTLHASTLGRLSLCPAGTMKEKSSSPTSQAGWPSLTRRNVPRTRGLPVFWYPDSSRHPAFVPCDLSHSPQTTPSDESLGMSAVRTLARFLGNRPPSPNTKKADGYPKNRSDEH